jgi:hypothetical protein
MMSFEEGGLFVFPLFALHDVRLYLKFQIRIVLQEAFL